MPVQETSRTAYRQFDRGSQRKRILEAYETHGPLTDNELHRITGVAINAICGMRNDLVHRGAVVDTGRKRKGPHGVLNIVWGLKPDAPKQSRLI